MVTFLYPRPGHTLGFQTVAANHQKCALYSVLCTVEAVLDWGPNPGSITVACSSHPPLCDGDAPQMRLTLAARATPLLRRPVLPRFSPALWGEDSVGERASKKQAPAPLSPWESTRCAPDSQEGPVLSDARAVLPSPQAVHPRPSQGRIVSPENPQQTPEGRAWCPKLPGSPGSLSCASALSSGLPTRSHLG